MARTGRPREFDRAAAVEQAMHLFWQHGFEGASLEKLRQAMGGISSASFYAAFDCKEALYREALSCYLGTHGKVMAALRDPDLAPRRRIEMALRGSVAMQTDPSHPSGCMVTLSATIGSEAAGELRALTAAERAANRAAIMACVRQAIQDGELAADTDAEGLGTLFEGLLVGLSIQARDGVAAGAIDAAVTAALTAWDAAAAPRRRSPARRNMSAA
ncbi:TetR/AcrR family transcriptional regulator [Rhizosaccharibacter radicis]|uniref:TetR/AcrR family transcriptional regulator n=1 Tax=Rhizosaccharibacter radicis TaxID=2782605 RepID=A0ABT1VV80_9PROT|nr:TetR/AcrR family transcriptional regulator [Acetobacteraceae bacterium KSS12]